MIAKWIALAFGWLSACTCFAQQAEVIGSFTGIITTPVFDPFLSGKTVTGTFQIGPGTPGTELFSSPSEQIFSQDYFSLSLNLPHYGIVSFASPGGAVTLMESPGSQTISYSSGFDTYYYGVGVTFAAAAGSLFTGSDPSSFHGGVVNLPLSGLSLSAFGAPGCGTCSLEGSMQFSTLQFGTAASAVPESRGSLMTMLGMVLVLSTACARGYSSRPCATRP
jgi:hypothetical protein